MLFAGVADGMTRRTTDDGRRTADDGPTHGLNIGPGLIRTKA